MTRRRFYTLLSGLSGDAVWRQVSKDFVSVIDDDEQIRQALHR
ncbi:hypothetical protein [Streptomyces sp. MMS20-AI2-20]|nr:hypothetical protein [Streptomyces sp. MMS20-AI2-20]